MRFLKEKESIKNQIEFIDFMDVTHWYVLWLTQSSFSDLFLLKQMLIFYAMLKHRLEWN